MALSGNSAPEDREAESWRVAWNSVDGVYSPKHLRKHRKIQVHSTVCQGQDKSLKTVYFGDYSLAGGFRSDHRNPHGTNHTRIKEAITT